MGEGCFFFFFSGSCLVFDFWVRDGVFFFLFVFLGEGWLFFFFSGWCLVFDFWGRDVFFFFLVGV